MKYSQNIFLFIWIITPIEFKCLTDFILPKYVIILHVADFGSLSFIWNFLVHDHEIIYSLILHGLNSPMQDKLISWKVFVFKFSAMGIKPRVFQMLDKWSATNIYSNIYASMPLFDCLGYYYILLSIFGLKFLGYWSTQKVNRCWIWLTCASMCKNFKLRIPFIL